MKKTEIIEQIKELEDKNDEWSTYFDKLLFQDNYVDDTKIAIKNLLSNLWTYCKEKIGDEPFDIERELKPFKLPDRAVEILSRWSENYSKLRIFNSQDIDGERLLRDIFDNIIVYYNGVFFNEAKKYNIEDTQIFIESVTTIDHMVSTEVYKRHNAQIAWKTVSKYLDDKFQSTFMNLYGTNYETIQRGLLIILLRNQAAE